ncbi:hypothetical protein GCM10009801_16100 [Streptomyces albiaxialis]|uniref:Integral membrane protein n=1 Tax=Streptomyces albiaxialis TaxID=329523 RepID=A0ABN2VP54_9ACTN
MTTLLEARYRAVLRLLPASYRRVREEEMVDTYLGELDTGAQEQARPTVGEVASIAALAVRVRLGAPDAERPYAVLGRAARHFALFALLLLAASSLADRVLSVTWATGGGHAERQMFLTGFTGQGPVRTAAAVAEWVLPLLWTAGYAALVRDRRRLARTCVLLAALPTLWPLLAPLGDAWAPDASAYTWTTALFAWLTALALCAAYHHDAPSATLPSALPAGRPGLVFAACCVAMGAAVTTLPEAADGVWAPASVFVLGSLGWLLLRARRPDRHAEEDGGTALALAALGLVLLALRLSMLDFWLAVPLPSLTLGSVLAQAVALALMTAALTAVGFRGAAGRRRLAGR